MITIFDLAQDKKLKKHLIKLVDGAKQDLEICQTLCQKILKISQSTPLSLETEGDVDAKATSNTKAIQKLVSKILSSQSDLSKLTLHCILAPINSKSMGDFRYLESGSKSLYSYKLRLTQKATGAKDDRAGSKSRGQSLRSPSPNTRVNPKNP